MVDGPWYLSKTEQVAIPAIRPAHMLMIGLGMSGTYKARCWLQDQDHRTLHGLPSFVGTGMTITMWYRHVPCEMENCGVYLFVARNEAAYCWSFWLENTAWLARDPLRVVHFDSALRGSDEMPVPRYFDNVKGTPKFQYPRNFVDAKFNLNGNTVSPTVAACGMRCL